MSRLDRPARLATVTALLLLLSACGGPGGPAPSGGPGGSVAPADCGLGAVADEMEFGRHFTSMTLEGAAGSPGVPDPDGGVRFPTDTNVLVRVVANATTTVRLCVATRDSRGLAVVDFTADLGVEHGASTLGNLVPGSYVLRVAYEGILIRNLPFTIE